MIKLSAEQARRLVVNSQGVYAAAKLGTGATAVAEILKRLSYVQIDTISVVERAHHHVFWSRHPKYQHSWLDKALEEKLAFEYWSHAAAYLPMRDYRYSLPKKRELAGGGKHWFDKDPQQAKYVLDVIRERGPMMARDFKQARSIKNPGWGDRKPAKQALERLFMEGELMIARRDNFQKVFDLTERVLPSDIDNSLPSNGEFLDYLIFRCLDAQGIATAAQIAYLRKGMAAKVQQRCLVLCAQGHLKEARVNNQTYFLKASFEALISQRIPKTSIKILSPFDNLLIQRQRASDIFDFDYQIECYVPAPKRQYGYFVLPILQGTRFIGRVDARADRKRKVLELNGLWFESDRAKSAKDEVVNALEKFADFNQVEFQA